jgi:hypothetical protein
MKFSVRIVVYIFFPRNDIFVYKKPRSPLPPASFVEWNLFYIPAAAPQRFFLLFSLENVVERVISAAAHSTPAHILFFEAAIGPAANHT